MVVGGSGVAVVIVAGALFVAGFVCDWSHIVLVRVAVLSVL